MGKPAEHDGKCFKSMKLFFNALRDVNTEGHRGFVILGMRGAVTRIHVSNKVADFLFMLFLRAKNRIRTSLFTLL